MAEQQTFTEKMEQQRKDIMKELMDKLFETDTLSKVDAMTYAVKFSSVIHTLIDHINIRVPEKYRQP